MASPLSSQYATANGNLTSQLSPLFTNPFHVLLRQISFAAVPSLLVGAALIYCINYTVVTRNRRWQNVFTVLALGAFAFAHFGARVDCPPFASFKNCPLAIGVLKVLDMWMRRDKPLKYRGAQPKQLPVPKASSSSSSSDLLTVDRGPPMGLSPSPSPDPTPMPSPILSSVTSSRRTLSPTPSATTPMSTPEKEEEEKPLVIKGKKETTEPAAWYQAFLLLTQLRYESFTPNPIRLTHERFSEPVQFILHLMFFVVLQHLPQEYNTVIAFEVNISVYLIFTGFQLLLRFNDSPPIFSPLYTADSIAGFWTETWHNAFTSPCTSIAYDPVRNFLQKMGVPRNIARSAGLISAFGLMAVFHVYAVYPVLPLEGTIRIGLFFLINGIATAVEVGIWGRKRHWLRRTLAWVFEIALATWVAEATRVPRGLRSIRWAEICGVPGGESAVRGGLMGSVM